MKTRILFVSLLSCLFLMSCNKTGKQLTANAWKTYVQDVAVYGEDSIYLDASISFFSFEKKGLGCSGIASLIGKGDCLFWIPDVKDSRGNYYLLPNGQRAKALMERFTTFKAVGKWKIDGEKVIIEWNPDSTTITSGSNNTSASNDFYCKSIQKEEQSSFLETNKENIENRFVTLEPFFEAVFKKWIDDRTELVYDDNEESWVKVKDGLPVMWELKFKNE